MRLCVCVRVQNLLRLQFGVSVFSLFSLLLLLLLLWKQNTFKAAKGVDALNLPLFYFDGDLTER